MKNILLLCLYFFCTQLLLAQTPTFSIGTPYKVFDANKKYYFSDPVNNLILAIKKRNNKIIIQRFDLKSLKETKRSSIIPLSNFTYIYDIVRIYGGIYLLQVDHSNGRRNLTLFAQQVNPFNCTLMGDPIPVLEGKNISTIRTQQHGKDGNLLLLGFREDKIGNNEQRFAYCNVLGRDLTSISKHELFLPHKKKQVDIIDYHLDPQGVPYLLTKVHPLKNSRRNVIGKGKNAIINYQLEVLKLDLTDGSYTTTPIKLEHYQIESSWLSTSTDNHIICAGFYSKRESKTIEPDGIFIFKINSETKLLEDHYYEFPIEILTQYKNARQQSNIAQADRKGQAEMDNLKLKKVLVQEDNSLVIIGEIDFVATYTNSSTHTRTSYHYYDILITKINPDGSLAWMRKLPKRQIGAKGRGGMSFKHMKSNNKHYFIYLDHPKNNIVNVYELPSIYTDGRRAILTAYQVDDKTGRAKKAQILDTQKNKSKYQFFQFNTGRVVPVSTSIIIEFYKKSKQNILVNINLNK